MRSRRRSPIFTSRCSKRWGSVSTPSPTARARSMNSLRSEIMSRVKSCGVFAMALLVSAVGLRGAGSDARLADAAERMDRAAIGTLLQQHVDVNAPQIDGMTALHWATYADDLDTAQLLVRAGANAK